MDHINLKVNSKLSITINKQTFSDIVNSLNLTIENIKVNTKKTKVHIVPNSNNVIISLDLKVKQKQNLELKNIFKLIKEKVEMHCLLLIEQKPINVLINYTGNFK